MKQDPNALYQVYVFRADDKKKQDVRPVSDWPSHFRLSSVAAEQNSMKLDRKRDFNVLW